MPRPRSRWAGGATPGRAVPSKLAAPSAYEAAAARALAIRALSYRSVESILRNGLDGLPLPGSEPITTIGDHANVRGAGYYE